MSDFVRIYEVSPRDGLQNESVIVSTEDKIKLVSSLAHSGIQSIELTSFVSPRWIPQLSDAEKLIEETKNIPAKFSALCPNQKGLDRALLSGISEIAIFISASESHNMANLNRSIESTISIFSEFVPEAIHHSLKIRGYISTVWGCPYEGAVSFSSTIYIANKLLSLGCYEISLGDTIGIGTPNQTKEIIQLITKEIPLNRIALHMHDTRGTALANILVGLELGIRTFDSSIAGLGGCPYAPGAAGNIATEDLVFMLHGMGFHTGIDLNLLIESGNLAEQILGHPLPGKVHRAGPLQLRKKKST